MATRRFSYIKQDDSGASRPTSFNTLMNVAANRIVKGEGKFLLLIDGEQVGGERSRLEALSGLARQVELGDIGHAYRVRSLKLDKVVFTAREVKLAPEVIDTSGNAKADAYWTGLKAEFPDVTFLGALVCKADSQHRFGNAVDGGFASQKMGEEMWQWAIDNHKKFDIRNAIVQEKIWHLGKVSPYDGAPHVAHTHADFDPMFDTDLPCGLRP